MPSLEACEPWVFRRNLLLSVCPVELFPTHQLLLSAGEGTLMLCGPFGCPATAVCVLCLTPSQTLNVLPVGWASLPRVFVCTAEVLHLEKPRGLQALQCGQQGTGPAAASPGRAQTLTVLPLCLPGAVLGSCWSTRPEGKGTHRQRISPQSSLILWNAVPCGLFDSVFPPWSILYTRIGHPLLPVLNMH